MGDSFAKVSEARTKSPENLSKRRNEAAKPFNNSDKKGILKVHHFVNRV